uniref:Reverse transcriptase domain-containing protein n=1 Tax=Tanacetum cinerariifolium TaxID=118510 RepID=A0A6L2JB36_TANCI|nr:reverse transcriptase domain-containing protein [Tanacetum cinerariifolium]
MPFGLRNAGATYQRLVENAFHKQIGRNLEVYVDDLIIKSRTEDEIVRDVEETFKTLREINMKLNPKKCAFWVEEGMFLGYKVNAKGLKVCPDKVDAVLSLPSPKCLKHVQKLNGKLASLNRALRGPNFNYTSMEKLVLALVHASKHSVKGQILADFVVERPEEGSPDIPMEEEVELPEPWILFMDGSSCVDGFGAGLILLNPKGMEFTYALRFRFGLRGEIILDNEKQFRDDPFKDWCEKLCMPTFRTAEVDTVGNNKALEINLDLLKERREEATIREAKSKANMEKYYNSKVRNTSFKPGDLVYCNNDASRAEDTRKLGPKWERPYEVRKHLEKRHTR